MKVMKEIVEAGKGLLKMSKLPGRMKAKINDGGNIKLGKTIGVFNKLMGDRVYYVPEYKSYVKGSCGHFCENCKGDCYVEKSYIRYTNQETGECSVIKGHARNTIAFYVDIDQAFIDLDGQLTRKRKKYMFVRIDQSGELISTKEYLKWAWLAMRHPETQFYIYTKAFVYVMESLLAGLIPDNLTTLFSIWHTYGIEEYNKVKHLSNVKAFVYMDKNKDPKNGWGIEEYAAHGIIIGTMCKAYDTNGKMNHNITCDVCQKCMNRLMSSKVIGCWAH